MAPRACKAGIKYRRGKDGPVEYGPACGRRRVDCPRSG